MWSKFCKNTILMGTVDYYCLACEFLLRSEDDVNTHIEKPIHKKNFEKTTYVATCPEDCIRKVSKGYYCEPCNAYLTTMTKVNLHRTDDEHVFNKSDDSERLSKPSFLKWIRNAVVAFDDVLIAEGAWNGFIDETCALCDTEYGDRELHRCQTPHILRVIQSKVQIGGDNSLSRKIDDSTHQCLTCNIIVMANNLPAHFDTPAHKKTYLECRKLKRENSDPNVDKTKVNDKAAETKVTKPKETKTKELTTVETKKDTVKAKEASGPVVKKKEIPKEFTTDINELFGTTNYLEHNGDHLLCLLCGWKMDHEMGPKHVVGEHHKTMERMQRERNEKIKKEYECKEKSEKAKKKQDKEEKIDKLQKKEDKQEKTEKSSQKKAKKQTKIPEMKPEKTEKKEEIPEASDSEINKTKILDSVQIFQKKGVLIDLISDKAFCKKCCMTLEFVVEVIESHINDHNKKKKFEVGEQYPTNIQSESAQPEVETTKEMYAFEVTETVEPKIDDNLSETEVEEITEPIKTDKPAKQSKDAKKAKPDETEDESAFAVKNDLTYNRDFNKAFCRVCNTKIPSSLKSMKEHVNGNLHKAKSCQNQLSVADMKPAAPQYKSMKMEEFVESLLIHETNYKIIAIVNEKYALSVISFLMMTKNDYDMLRCHVCETGLAPSDVDDHKRTRKHSRALNTTPVVLGLPTEFVREVRPGIFHCGFCNLVESGWDTMQRHLASETHYRHKMVADWSLEESLPAIREHLSQREDMMMITFMRMLMGNRRLF